jgi:two-component system, NarL family, invasion response regulator UvrY
LVDDNAAMSAAVSDALTAAGITVAAIARTGREAVRWLRTHHAEIVILDARVPDLPWLSVVAGVTETAPAAAVILYTSYATQRLATDALAAGAGAVALKSLTPQNLIAAVEHVAAGRTYVDPQLRPAGD